MKKTVLIITFIVSACVSLRADGIDSLEVCFKNMQTLEDKNAALESDLISVNEELSNQLWLIDSLNSELAKTNQELRALADSLNLNVANTQRQIQTNAESVNTTISDRTQKGLWIFTAIAIVIILIAVIFGLLLTERKKELASLSAKADKINEEIVSRMSTEMSEMQAISKQISSLSSVSGGDTDSEQKLIKTLADRITFMEMTLYKMDSSVRGHKQLSKSIKQMKDNLLANGYELVDMLGKDYHDGMKVIANFVEDEELPAGKQVITGIIKPQINYKGKMIQSAQITVSQNL